MEGAAKSEGKATPEEATHGLIRSRTENGTTSRTNAREDDGAAPEDRHSSETTDTPPTPWHGSSQGRETAGLRHPSTPATGATVRSRGNKNTRLPKISDRQGVIGRLEDKAHGKLGNGMATVTKEGKMRMVPTSTDATTNSRRSKTAAVLAQMEISQGRENVTQEKVEPRQQRGGDEGAARKARNETSAAQAKRSSTRGEGMGRRLRPGSRRR